MDAPQVAFETDSIPLETCVNQRKSFPFSISVFKIKAIYHGYQQIALLAALITAFSR
ncbi:MAG: hypothetical protein ACJAWL_002210 [Motiliproteus sp.]|jgi:hypothetical protein